MPLKGKIRFHDSTLTHIKSCPVLPRQIPLRRIPEGDTGIPSDPPLRRRCRTQPASSPVCLLLRRQTRMPLPGLHFSILLHSYRLESAIWIPSPFHVRQTSVCRFSMADPTSGVKYAPFYDLVTFLSLPASFPDP